MVDDGTLFLPGAAVVNVLDDLLIMSEQVHRDENCGLVDKFPNVT
jgi:hypothetical protein